MKRQDTFDGSSPTVPSHREAKELSLLYQISETLDHNLDLRAMLEPVLAAMAKQLGMLRGTVTLVNRKTGEIIIETSVGLSAGERQRGRYKLGEGVTGKVVQTGKPVIIPRVSQEPLFLDRTRARTTPKQDHSFICVPIRFGREVIGTLSADRVYSEHASLQDDVRLLSIIAAMIYQAVRMRQIAHEERQRLLDENIRLHEELKDKFRPSNIIGNSHVMQEVYDLIARAAKSDTTVLIRGESGVGKELVAHAIHYNSARAKKPFIKVSCAALPETVLESELFGHEAGSFTGAISQRKGRFELAHGGSIFLDEIGDISPATQIKLLRVLQEREFERVGGTASIKSDVRIIAATNRDLEKMIELGQFRADLYYRLNVFPIHVPALRERKTDILLLADFFVEKFSKANRKKVRRISTPAINMMMAYHWPGNVRELENCIERAVILSDDDVIHGHHLPPTLQTAEASGTVHKGALAESIEGLERELILDALKSARGNMAKAARELGLSERIMGLRVKYYGVDPKRFRVKVD